MEAIKLIWSFVGTAFNLIQTCKIGVANISIVDVFVGLTLTWLFFKFLILVLKKDTNMQVSDSLRGQHSKNSSQKHGKGNKH